MHAPLQLSGGGIREAAEDEESCFSDTSGPQRGCLERHHVEIVACCVCVSRIALWGRGFQTLTLGFCQAGFSLYHRCKTPA